MPWNKEFIVFDDAPTEMLIYTNTEQNKILKPAFCPSVRDLLSHPVSRRHLKQYYLDLLMEYWQLSRIYRLNKKDFKRIFLEKD